MWTHSKLRCKVAGGSRRLQKGHLRQESGSNKLRSPTLDWTQKGGYQPICSSYLLNWQSTMSNSSKREELSSTISMTSSSKPSLMLALRARKLIEMQITKSWQLLRPRLEREWQSSLVKAIQRTTHSKCSTLATAFNSMSKESASTCLSKHD